MKKYEIYLPLKYNDGSDIEPEKLEEIQQLIVVFGAMADFMAKAELCVRSEHPSSLEHRSCYNPNACCTVI